MTLPRRLDNAGLEALIGRPALDRKARRHRGGAAAGKGQDYEHLFVAHRTARLFRKFHEYGADAVVEWQSAEFVDDVVIRRDAENSFKAYQLKNSPDVSWTAGENPIADDFGLQIQICSAEGYTDTRLRLVCSDVARAEVLRESVPEAIATHSKAFFFPFEQPSHRLVSAHMWLADDFGYLSRHERPSLVDCADVVQVLAGAWTMMKPVATVSEIYAKARQTSPTVLRPVGDMGAEARLSADFRRVLDAIEGFDYAVERGFLIWFAPGARTGGTLSFDCFSARFEKFQHHVVELGPNTFEQIEALLV